MAKQGKMATVWNVGRQGELLCAHSGRTEWTSVSLSECHFPLSAADVAALMNTAFAMGAEAKSAEIRVVLNLGA